MLVFFGDSEKLFITCRKDKENQIDGMTLSTLAEEKMYVTTFLSTVLDSHK